MAANILAGAGIGFVNPPLATTAIGVVEPRRSGTASGINTGIAGLGALFQARVENKLAGFLPEVPEPQQPARPARIGSAASSRLGRLRAD